MTCNMSSLFWLVASFTGYDIICQSTQHSGGAFLERCPWHVQLGGYLGVDPGPGGGIISLLWPGSTWGFSSHSSVLKLLPHNPTLGKLLTMDGSMDCIL